MRKQTEVFATLEPGAFAPLAAYLATLLEKARDTAQPLAILAPPFAGRSRCRFVLSGP